jgi:2-oxo-3-hexenedioate decarboxylase
MSNPPPRDAAAIAATVLGASAERRQVAPFTANLPDFDLDAAYAVTAAVRRARIARGERPVGRKIGFTNRTIWAEYGVYAPIWGDMYDSTLRDLAATDGTLDLSPLLEPRIEPEIAFGFEAAPQAGMSEREILGCIAWVAHGFEIVQSVFPGWKFQAADTVAAYALHGAYRLGQRHPIAAADRPRWLELLRSFEIELSKDGTVIDRGRATNVLDGPLSTIGHLLEVLSRDQANPPLGAGEIVTTGTVTRAFPVAPGETWTTKVIGLPLDGIALRFVGS